MGDWVKDAKELMNIWDNRESLKSYLDDIHSDMDADIDAVKQGKEPILSNKVVIEAIQDIMTIEYRIKALAILEYGDMLSFRYEDTDACCVINDFIGRIESILSEGINE